jgi:hypothetical protein
MNEWNNFDKYSTNLTINNEMILKKKLDTDTGLDPALDFFAGLSGRIQSSKNWEKIQSEIQQQKSFCRSLKKDLTALQVIWEQIFSPLKLPYVTPKK